MPNPPKFADNLAALQRDNPDLTETQLAQFANACDRMGLDPAAKQIYAITRGGKLSIQVAIDGYRLVADRTGAYAGNDDAVFTGTTPDGFPEIGSVTVHKIVQGVVRGFTASARWAEYYPGDRAGAMWKNKPHVMLAKVAEALALRKAFPAELSGVYTFDEITAEKPVMLDAKQKALLLTLSNEAQIAPAAARKRTAEITADGFDEAVARLEKLIEQRQDAHAEDAERRAQND